VKDNLLYFNGINGASGTYGLEPMTDQELSDLVIGIGEREPDNLADLKEKLKQDAANKIFDVTKSLLSASNAEPDLASRRAWQEELIRKLGAISLTRPSRNQKVLICAK
jgi:hypothetical protein